MSNTDTTDNAIIICRGRGALATGFSARRRVSQQVDVGKRRLPASILVDAVAAPAAMTRQCLFKLQRFILGIAISQSRLQRVQPAIGAFANPLQLGIQQQIDITVWRPRRLPVPASRSGCRALRAKQGTVVR